ncbi:MAG: hypothetical protein KatS3mg050_1630 [Litorilinea sp.]|nr:MAG: hypothetical protein KatS3mg050_1630 [Litorilinea sp.]
MAACETEGDCRRLVQSGVNTTAEIRRHALWWVLSANFCRDLLEGRRQDARPSGSLIWLWCILLGASLWLGSCRSIRPMVKIGLLAPFEGLYRQSGYEALAAMRAAIQDTPVPHLDILPLALNDMAEPHHARRAAEKLLVDPAVQAVVGPLDPATWRAVLPVLGQGAPHWVVPFQVARPHGFAPPQDPPSQWASGLIEAVATAAAAQGAQRLILAGWEAGWPRIEISLPAIEVKWVDDGAWQISGLRATDAVLWLGSPAEGAKMLTAVRQVQPEIPFWLASQGGDPVFGARATITGPVFWAIWSDSGYNPWATTHTPNSPAAYLVYQSTRYAIAVISGITIPPAGGWEVRLFQLLPGGESIPLSLEALEPPTNQADAGGVPPEAAPGVREGRSNP